MAPGHRRTLKVAGLSVNLNSVSDKSRPMGKEERITGRLHGRLGTCLSSQYKKTVPPATQPAITTPVTMTISKGLAKAGMAMTPFLRDWAKEWEWGRAQGSVGEVTL